MFAPETICKRTTNNLSETFNELPSEIQLGVLQKLDSREHLVALSLSSRNLHALCADCLHSDVTFDSLTPDESIQSYVTSTLPLNGGRCKDLKLSFSLGPCIDRLADRQRAKLFAKVLQGVKARLTTLEINTAASNLSDTAETLQAVLYAGLTALKSLRLTFHDIQESEVDAVTTFFYHLSAKPSSLPCLRSLSIEGFWVLASHPYDPNIFSHLHKALRALPQLFRLRLADLTISNNDLALLLNEVPLTSLVFDEIDGLFFSDCLTALAEAKVINTLEDLNIILHATSPTTSKLNLSSRNIVFPLLKRLSLGLKRYYARPKPESALLPLIGTLFSALFQSGTSEARFPALSSLELLEEPCDEQETSLATEAIRSVIQGHQSGTMPHLCYIYCNGQVLLEVGKLTETLSTAAESSTYQLHSPVFQSSRNRPIFYNRMTNDEQPDGVELAVREAALLNLAHDFGVKSIYDPQSGKLQTI